MSQESVLDQVARRVRAVFRVGPFGPNALDGLQRGGRAMLTSTEASEVTRLVVREARLAGLDEPFDPAWRVNPPAGWFVFGTHVDHHGPLEFWGEEFDVETAMPIWERPVGSTPG